MDLNRLDKPLLTDLSGSLRPMAETSVQDFAAELAEAAFPVILRRGLDGDWLQRKLELWNVMVQTVKGWQQGTSASLS